MLEFIAFLIFVILLGLSLFLNLYQYSINKKITNKLLQETVNRLALLDKLSKEMENKDAKSVEQTDGFLRFISQSRDWAFEYIEDVQEKLVKFGIDLNDILTFGKNKKEISKQILEAYKPLQDLLPDEQGEK